LRNQNGSPAFGVQPALNFGATDVQYFLNALPEGKGLSLWSAQQRSHLMPQLNRRQVTTLEIPAGAQCQTGPVRTGD
jgi:hypothetical protein